MCATGGDSCDDVFYFGLRDGLLLVKTFDLTQVIIDQPLLISLDDSSGILESVL